MRVGLGALALCLAAACGQTERNADVLGNTGGEAGGGGATTGASGAVTTTSSGEDASTGTTSTDAGTTVGGAPVPCSEVRRADLPPLAGQEYLLSWEHRGEPSHLRFDSETDAVHSLRFGASDPLRVQRGSCADLQILDVGPDRVEITGPIVLVDEYGVARVALSESVTRGVGSDALLRDAFDCRYSPTSTATAGSVESDTTPTEARVTTEFDGVLLPWDPMLLEASKPPASPLSESVRLVSSGAEVAFEPLSDSQIVLSDWYSALGTALEVSGSVDATNGVASSISKTLLEVPELVSESAVLDLSESLPAGARVLGAEPSFRAPGEQGCSNGCLELRFPAALVFALRGPGSRVVVRYVGYTSGGISHGATLELHLPGADPAYGSLWESAELSTHEVELAAELGDDAELFGILRATTYLTGVQPGLGECSGTPVPTTVYLERIELVE